MELDDNQGRAVLNLLENVNLYQRHGHAVVRMLCALVKDGGMPCALELLPQANKIAASLFGPISTATNLGEKIELAWIRLSLSPVLAGQPSLSGGSSKIPSLSNLMASI